MESNKNQGGLLPRLQCLSGCQYLSDLHNRYYIGEILYALGKINIASYSTKEWLDAYAYITGNKPKEDSKEGVAEGLIRWLKAQLE